MRNNNNMEKNQSTVYLFQEYCFLIDIPIRDSHTHNRTLFFLIFFSKQPNNNKQIKGGQVKLKDKKKKSNTISFFLGAIKHYKLKEI